MEIKEIDIFSKNVVLESSYVSCSQGIQNLFSIRVFIESERIEYRFYDVAEYIQSKKDRASDYKITQIISSPWVNEIESNEIDKSSLKHFMFYTDKCEFNILAVGFVRDKGFTEIYKEQELVKKLLI